MSWVAVVPVKGSASAKSRLGDLPDRGRLAEAFALDTVTALLGTSVIERVFVVTADEAIADRLSPIGAVIVRELARKALSSVGKGRFAATRDPIDPLNRAIRQGVDAARETFPECNIAVVTGDLPSLTVADLETALAHATAHERSMVPDEDGTGTTVLLALAGVPFMPRFGPRSRAAHEAAGHVPLDLAETMSIRRDVDTVDNLADAMRLGVGPYTSVLIASSSAAIAAEEGRSRIQRGTAAERMPAASSAGTAAASVSSTSQASSTSPDPREP